MRRARRGRMRRPLSSPWTTPPSSPISRACARELLQPQVRGGRACSPRESIEDARARCAAALASLDPAYKRFLYPQSYMVGMEAGLARERDELVRERMAAASSVLPWRKARA